MRSCRTRDADTDGNARLVRILVRIYYTAKSDIFLLAHFASPSRSPTCEY